MSSYRKAETRPRRTREREGDYFDKLPVADWIVDTWDTSNEEKLGLLPILLTLALNIVHHQNFPTKKMKLPLFPLSSFCQILWYHYMTLHHLRGALPHCIIMGTRPVLSPRQYVVPQMKEEVDEVSRRRKRGLLLMQVTTIKISVYS